MVFALLPPGLVIGISYLSGGGFLLYFAFVFASIAASFGWLLLREWRKIASDSISGVSKLRLDVPAGNTLFEIAGLLFATISFSVLYYLIIYSYLSPTVPKFGKMPLWTQLYGFARAGVWEEIVSRIPFIGLPLLFVDIARGRRAPLYRYLVGGGFKTDRATVLLITIAALIFGVAHATAGWDVFKIIPAMVGGMAMGYLYTKRGIHASMLLHFANDYLSMPSELFHSSALGIAADLFLLGGTVIGVYFFYLYSKSLLFKMLGKDAKKERSPRINPVPPPPWSPNISDSGYIPPYASFPYRCPICGNTEANYLGNGLLKCTKCGAISRIPPPKV